MKSKLSAVFMVGILLVTMLFSGAAYAGDNGQPATGITPDSPFFFLDKIGKSLSLAFTFNSEAKARKTLQYADERLAEAQQMASENKTAALQKAIADFEAYLNQLQTRLAAIKQQAASDNLSEQTALTLMKNLEVLERVRMQVPDKAKDAIAHAGNVSMNGQINALRNLGKDKPDRAFDICDNITARQMDRVRARISDNVTTANVSRELDYAQRIADLEEELANIGQASGANVTALQERLAHSTANRLQALSGIYQKAPDSALPGLANAIENSVQKYQRVVSKLEDKNAVTAATANATLNVIPEKLREKIKVSTSNRLQNNGTNDTIRTSQQTQEQNRARPENKTTPPPVTATANRTREQQPTQDQVRNNQGRD